MAPKSLVELCVQVAIRHVNMINDFGDLPLNHVLRILSKVDNAKQLRQLELSDPRFAAGDNGDEDGEGEGRAGLIAQWNRLIAKHFPALYKTRNYVPKNSANWYKIYERYKKEDIAENAKAEDALKQQMAMANAKKEARQSQIVESRLLPKPPKDSRYASVARRAGAGNATAADARSHLSFAGGSRTKPTKGQNFLKKAKREAREIANRRAISTPSGQLTVPSGQMAKAPESMINEYRLKKKNDAVLRILAPRSKAKALDAKTPEQRLREARLLRIKNQATAIPAVATVIDDDDDADDDVGLSGEAPRSAAKSPDYGPLTDSDDGPDEDAREKKSPSQMLSTKRQTTMSPASRTAGAGTKIRPLLSGHKDGRGHSHGLLSNAYKPDRPKPQPDMRSTPRMNDSAAAAAAVETKIKPRQPSHSPPTRPTPNMLSSSTSQPATSPEPGSAKRKPEVDVFMRKKRKVK